MNDGCTKRISKEIAMYESTITLCDHPGMQNRHKAIRMTKNLRKSVKSAGNIIPQIAQMTADKC
jgi:hypothetical protein